jgi:hypothetical protein
MDTRLIDKNGVVIVEECPFPKPGESILSTIFDTSIPIAYVVSPGFSPELRHLDIGGGLGKKWYHVVVVEPKDDGAVPNRPPE